MVDKFEGLIVVNAATLLDGDPLNNYLGALDRKDMRAAHSIQGAERCQQHHLFTFPAPHITTAVRWYCQLDDPRILDW